MPPHANDHHHEQHQQHQQQQQQQRHVNKRDDFRIVKMIGHGDMGTVFLVASRADNAPFAMKVMKKDVLAARDNLRRAETERDILKKLNHPFLPRLHAHFEDDKHTFLVTDYCSGGDLNILRQKQTDKRFSENAARFYAAEVLLALEYLHKLGIVYRDLKPENVLIQADGHIMLTDFDLSLHLPPGSGSSNPKPSKKKGRKLAGCGIPSPIKLLRRVRNTRRAGSPMARIFPKSAAGSAAAATSSECRSNSFVGTEEYVAPEVVWGCGHGMPVDWWTLGIFLYELVFGKTPFKGSRRKDTFYNILCKDADIPGPPSALRDLISKLLVKNPFERLGSKLGAAEIRNHGFFHGTRWNEIELVARPPFIPGPFSLEEADRRREADMEELLTKKRKHHHHHHHQHHQHHHHEQQQEVLQQQEQEQEQEDVFRHERHQRHQVELEQEPWLMDQHGANLLLAAKVKSKNSAPMMVTNAAAVETICSSYDRFKAEFSAEKRLADSTKLLRMSDDGAAGLDAHTLAAIATVDESIKLAFEVTADQASAAAGSTSTPPSEDLEEFQVF